MQATKQQQNNYASMQVGLNAKKKKQQQQQLQKKKEQNKNASQFLAKL